MPISEASRVGIADLKMKEPFGREKNESSKGLVGLPPKSTANFQQIKAGRELAANFLSPHRGEMISIYAVNSVDSKRWWWIEVRKSD